MEDIDVTKRLVEAGNIIGIEILDHVVVGFSGFLSFKEKGLL
ncbi:DNA repair protein RadC [Desulfocucumis palustris]|uniref:DNA repair protein RadC n=2 Tax=Desulfocucumis palustris TaxID=1898651 RepID=A0A2L2X9F5_9FIRM|nr:DNA repair protein RadC [Desulfocucumis palustris]